MPPPVHLQEHAFFFVFFVSKYGVLVDSSLCVEDSNTKPNFNTVLGLNCWNSLTGRVFFGKFLGEVELRRKNDKKYEFCLWKSDFVRFVLSDSRKHVEHTSSTRRAHVEHVERTARHVEHTSSTRRARKADRQKIPKSEVLCKSCIFFSRKGVFFPNFSNFRAALPENGSKTAIFWHQVAKRNRWQGQDFKTPEKKSQIRALACRNLNSNVK